MDLDIYLRFVAALAFVLGLIAAIAWALKHFGVNRVLGSRQANKAGRRLGIVESLPLDAKRRLVIVRRDAVEHLILIGATTELVIEQGIPAPPLDVELS